MGFGHVIVHWAAYHLAASFIWQNEGWGKMVVSWVKM